MPRVPRTQLPDGFFHVNTVAVAGMPAFFSDVDRIDFLRLLAECVRTYDWTFYAYCLMTTHYHLVVETPLPNLPLGMRQLNGKHARRFNRRHDRRGHLFEARFSAYAIQNERYLEASCRYVLENPVRAGLCSSARDWHWSGLLRTAAQSPTLPQHALRREEVVSDDEDRPSRLLRAALN